MQKNLSTKKPSCQNYYPGQLFIIKSVAHSRRHHGTATVRASILTKIILPLFLLLYPHGRDSFGNDNSHFLFLLPLFFDNLIKWNKYLFGLHISTIGIMKSKHYLVLGVDEKHLLIIWNTRVHNRDFLYKYNNSSKRYPSQNC